MGSVALLALLATAAAIEDLTAPELSYEPVFESTALDAWEPPWPPGPTTGERCSRMPSRWLVIGWDSADWRLVLPLLERGEMPHLAALMQSGVYGDLATFEPTVSPAIWTTVATGSTPAEHGIRHFYNQQPRLTRWWSRLTHFGHLERHLYSNADRRVPAVWNELSARQRPVIVIGYHNTFPVERVTGLMVSNYLVQDTVSTLMDIAATRSDASDDFAAGLVYPPEDLDEVLAIQERARRRLPQAVQRFAAFESERELRRFLQTSRRLEPEENQRPYFLSRAWLDDEVMAEVAQAYYPRIEPDLAMVHFQSLDWAAHHFLYFDRPHRFERFQWDRSVRRELEAMLPRYQDTVDNFYRFADDWLGRLVALTDETTAVLVLSDHGTRPGPDPLIPGNHDHAPSGLFVLSGPGIRGAGRLVGATIYDVLPTLMRGLGLPVAEDLPGHVLSAAFCPEALDSEPAIRIPTYRSDHFVPPISPPAELDEKLLRELESLGYLD